MKVKGRRQSDNVVDLRSPYAAARKDVQVQNDPERVAERIDEEVFHRDEAMRTQATIRDPVKEHFRRMKRENIPLEFGEVVNSAQARNIQENIRGRDAAGMEMLFGPRWKD